MCICCERLADGQSNLCEMQTSGLPNLRERNEGEISDKKWEELTEIDCDWCKNITQLPTLPTCLRELRCGYTKITQLPTLPVGLQILHCHATKITELPPLPAGLRRLYCSNTNITQLPSLPAGLQWLDCWNTSLSQLPTLPADLYRLYCGNTWIEHESNPNLKKNLIILRKVQRRLKYKLYLRRLSKRHLLKKIFSPQITSLILSY